MNLGNKLKVKDIRHSQTLSFSEDESKVTAVFKAITSRLTQRLKTAAIRLRSSESLLMTDIINHIYKYCNRTVKRH